MFKTAFFRICFPYGIEKCNDDTWFPFNRDYNPIGWNGYVEEKYSAAGKPFSQFPVHIKFKHLNDELIRAAFPKELFTEDAKGKITKVYFYLERTNPAENPELWGNYSNYVSFFSEFEIE